MVQISKNSKGPKSHPLSPSLGVCVWGGQAAAATKPTCCMCIGSIRTVLVEATEETAKEKGKKKTKKKGEPQNG
jgi:hypothetical protein